MSESSENPPAESPESHELQGLSKDWWWFTVLGAAMVVIGIICISCGLYMFYTGVGQLHTAAGRVKAVMFSRHELCGHPVSQTMCCGVRGFPVGRSAQNQRRPSVV